MLLQQLPKMVGTLSVFTLCSLSNSSAQNLMQIKGDSTVNHDKTIAAVPIAPPTQTDSTIKIAAVVVESNPIKVDAFSKTVETAVVEPKSVEIIVVEPKSVPFRTDTTLKTPKSALISSTKDDMEVFKEVEQQAEFDGGLTAFFKYLNVNLLTPPEALKARIDGRAYMSFVVNVDGSISDVTVRRTTYIKRLSDDKTVAADPKTDEAVIEALNKEAIRVMRAMPKWKPAKNGGEVVKSTFTMSVNF